MHFGTGLPGTAYLTQCCKLPGAFTTRTRCFGKPCTTACMTVRIGELAPLACFRPRRNCGVHSQWQWGTFHCDIACGSWGRRALLSDIETLRPSQWFLQLFAELCFVPFAECESNSPESVGREQIEIGM